MTTASPAESAARPVAPAGPEWWERIAPAVRAWAVRHPRGARRLARLRTFTLWASLPLAAAVALVAPMIWPGIVQVIAVLVPVTALWLLSPTRTISLGTLFRVLTAGALVAVAISGVCTLLMRLAALPDYAHGGPIGLAGPIEEVGKLLPLAAIVVAAPGLARRWSGADWLLLGYACGAAFLAVEEGIRWIALQEPGFGQLDYILEGRAIFPTVELNPFLLSGNEHDGVFSAGHAAWSGIVGGGLGIAMHVTQHRRALARAAVWLLPVGLLALVIVWHAMSNAAFVVDAWEAFAMPGLPHAWAVTWIITGFGWPAPAVLVVLWLTCLALDVARRDRAASLGVETLAPAAASRAAKVRAWAATPGRRVVAWVPLAGIQWGNDLRVTIGAFGRRRPAERRAAAVLRGRLRRATAVRARRAAMAATITPPSRRNRRQVRVAAFLASVLALGVVVLVGQHLLVALPELYTPDQGFLAGLFDQLLEAWDDLPWWGQALVGAAAIVTLVWLGAPLGLASTSVGIGTYLLDKDHRGAISMIRRDGFGNAATHYLSNRGPADMLLDLGELVLTFVPGTRVTPALGGGDLTDEMIDLYIQETGEWAGRTIDDGIRESLNPTISPAGPPEIRLPEYGTGDIRTPTASAAGWEPTSGEPPPALEHRDLPAGGDVAGRTDLDPWTRYELPDGSSVYTDGAGRAVYVDAVTDSVARDAWRGTPGVVARYPDGAVWGSTTTGEIWFEPAR